MSYHSTSPKGIPPGFPPHKPSPPMSRPMFQTIRLAGLAVRTAWLLLGLTLLLLAALEFSFRGLFALKDRVAKPIVPAPRVIRDGYAGATWPIDHVARAETPRRPLGALRLLPPEAVRGQDHHDRRPRPTRGLASPQSRRRRLESRQDPDARRLGALGIRRPRRPDDPVASGPVASRAGVAAEICNLSEIRLCEYPGIGRPRPRASGGLSTRRRPVLRRGQRHDFGSARGRAHA